MNSWKNLGLNVLPRQFLFISLFITAYIFVGFITKKKKQINDSLEKLRPPTEKPAPEFLPASSILSILSQINAVYLEQLFLTACRPLLLVIIIIWKYWVYLKWLNLLKFIQNNWIGINWDKVWIEAKRF